MSNKENLKTASLGFNMLGLFLSAGVVFFSLFGVALNVSNGPISVDWASIVIPWLFPLGCFIAAWGFRQPYKWAWYIAAVEMLVFSINGLVRLWKLEIGGLFVFVFSICVLMWLFKSYLNIFGDTDA